ncbi:hypothetical protein JCM21900_002465 [Sporobolomyces salmonicolor]
MSQPCATRWMTFPPVGTILLIFVFWLFIGIWTLAPTPYYRSRWNVGSPPLAIRAGLFAVGCFPFILAFGSKWNIVGSGIAALVPLVWLCWGSFSFIRNRSYELFKFLHIVSAVLFSAFLYIHCNSLLTSWHYLWATAAIYFAALLIRFSLILLRNGRRLPLAHIEALPDHAIRATISLPPRAGIRWTAGQHYFINFLKASAWESHPYTVANAPWIDPSSSAAPSSMVLLLRISPRTGLGPRLLRLASSSSSSPTTRILLDGPYGGPSVEFGRHDRVMLIAGGAGMSFAVAVLEELCGRMVRDEAECRAVRRVEVHWAVRRDDAKEWFDEQIECATRLVRDKVDLHLYVTGLNEDVDPKVAKDENHVSHPPSLAPWVTHHLLPSLPALLTSAFDTAPPNSSLGIGSCGPTSLTGEVRRIVARRQREFAFGKSGEGVGEVELWTEEFAW